MRINPPPNWPIAPGFTPGPGWEPLPEWGPAPAGWELWVPDVPAQKSSAGEYGLWGGISAVLGFVLLGAGAMQPVLKDAIIGPDTDLNPARVWLTTAGEALIFAGVLVLLVPIIAAAIRVARR